MTDEIAAIDWLRAFILTNAKELSPLGFRWLMNARTHLEDRVDGELRRSHGT